MEMIELPVIVCPYCGKDTSVLCDCGTPHCRACEGYQHSERHVYVAVKKAK